MFTRNYGSGWLGRLFTAVLEVIVLCIVLTVVAVVLAALAIGIPALIITLVKIGIAVYFVGRVFGLVGPA